jgi:hypothetical protein
MHVASPDRQHGEGQVLQARGRIAVEMRKLSPDGEQAARQGFSLPLFALVLPATPLHLRARDPPNRA